MSEYLIKGDTVTTWANHARRISGTTEELNAAEIAEIFSRTQGECLDEAIEVSDNNNENSSLYLIQDDTMNAMANHARRISGTTEELNATEIAEIISRTQGTVKTDGEYLVEALNAGGVVIKSGTYDTGEIFALPKSSDDIAVPTQDGYVTIATFDDWTATAPIGHNYIPVGDASIEAGALYKPVDDCFIIVVEVESANTTAMINFGLESGATINWGDGTIETIASNHPFSHTYTSTGVYVIKIPKKGCWGQLNDVYYDETTRAMIKGIVVPKWISETHNGFYKGINDLENLEYLFLEEGVVLVAYDDDSTFQNLSSLKHVALPKSMTTLNDQFFMNSSITTVVLPYGMTEIPFNCFNNCSNLKKITIPNSVTTIRTQAFSGCTSLTGNFVIPDSVTTIENGVFTNCVNLSSIIFPNTMTHIKCIISTSNSIINGLTVVLPSATSIGDSVFNNQYNLKLILQANEVCTLGTHDDEFSWATIYVPDTLVDSYKAHEQWSGYVDNIKPLSEYTGTI